MHVRSMYYLTTNNVLNHSQHGFRPRQNVTTAIKDILNNNYYEIAFIVVII